MKLTELRIESITYGDNKGKYQAKITYADPSGEIKVILDSAMSDDLLKTVGPMLNKYALNGMAEIQNAIVNATTNTTTQTT